MSYDYEKLKQSLTRDHFKRFEEIPKEYQNHETALLWMNSLFGNLVEIPQALRTMDVLRSSITSIPDTIKDIPCSTPGYLDLAQSALLVNAHVVKYIPQDLITLEFVYKVVRTNPRILIALQGITHYQHFLMNQDLIDYATKISLKAVSDLKSIKINEDCIRKRIEIAPIDIVLLPKIGRMHVLVEMIKEGYWPSTCKMGLMGKIGDRPSGIIEAADVAIEKEGTIVGILNLAFLMSQPEADTFKILSSREYERILFKVFSSQQIRAMTRDKCLLKKLLHYDFEM